MPGRRVGQGKQWGVRSSQCELPGHVQDQKRELASGAFDRRRPEEQQAARLANIRLMMDV
jgi:hypothetical protein